MADAKDEQPQMVNVNDQDGYAQLKSRVDELEKELHKKSTETNKALAELRTELGTKRRFKATERLAEYDFILRPLKNIKTHETVFLPPTLGDFRALTEREVEQLLRGLGEEPTGIAVEDFVKLAQVIGLPHSVVRTLYEP
ncbi:hypothetical protein F4679DRAFT_520983 [Xylaria curta]|nr:hypothetical protein F4679DRAFT_520983 [Xylaria curta]